MLNIIIEGVDRSGKSTLSDWLIKEFNLKHNHFTADQTSEKPNDIVLVPNVPVFYQFKNYLVDIEHKRMETYQFDKNGFEKNYNFLWDRFIYSDAVYGPIYKNFCRPIDKFEISFIEQLLQSTNTCIIHCQLEDEDLNWKLIEDEGLDLMSRDELTYFRQQYQDVFKSSMLPVFNYDFTKHSFEEVKYWVKQNCEANKQTAEEFMKRRHEILAQFNNNFEHFKHASFDLFMNLYISARRK